MATLLVGIAIMVAVVAFLCAFAFVEDRHLRAAAARYRQLELEGIEELHRDDRFSEIAAGERLVEPDGSSVAAHRILREELKALRRQTRPQRRGSSGDRS